MSSKLVKKLLQQTGELEDFSPAEKDSEQKSRESSKKRKRRQTESNDTTTTITIDKNDLLQRHIQSKIRMDQRISAIGKNATTQSADRIRKERKKQSKLKSKALLVDGGVGNSRGSSSQKIHQRHEPTFNKRKHQAEKKEKMIRDIAKLLKRTKK